MSAARVMAAGSVISEPMSGTSARHSQACAMAVLTGAIPAIRAISASMAASTGRDAATTMMTKTKRGSVYCLDSA